MIRRFVTVADRQYDSIRDMLRLIGSARPAAQAVSPRP
jgi:hypothetical protein